MMSYSYYTFYMSIFCAMLLTGEPGYMMAPKNTRMTIFVLSMMTVTYFNLSVLNMLLKFYNGVKAGGSLVTIVQMYMLLEQIGAVLPCYFIFLFDGLAFSPYALFNKQYGNWDEVEIDGMDEQVDDWMGNL